MVLSALQNDLLLFCKIYFTFSEEISLANDLLREYSQENPVEKLREIVSGNGKKGGKHVVSAKG